MKDDFLSGLLGNTARSRVLRVFVFNYSGPMTLGQIQKLARVSKRTAEIEVRALAKLRLIKKGKLSILLRGGKRTNAARQKQDAWELDPENKNALALSRFIHGISPTKHAKVVQTLRKAGRLSAVVLSGTFVGDPSRPADVLAVLETVNEKRLEAAMRSLELLFGRELRYAGFSTPEFRYRLTIHDRLIRETLDNPHLVVMDRANLLATR